MKIPKPAKKVFTGKIFDVYQWEQTMYDDTTETFEMLKRPDTVQIIPITTDHKILVNRQLQPQYTKPFYSLFGGRMDEGETPLEAAQRELLEEAGYRSDDWELLSTEYLYNKIEWNMYDFVARDCENSAPQNLDAGEKIEVLKLNFAEFMNIIIRDDFRSKNITIKILQLYYQNKLDEFKNKLFKKH